MYCVTLRLHDIKKLTSVSLEYTMEVHLANAYSHLSGESPPSKNTFSYETPLVATSQQRYQIKSLQHSFGLSIVSAHEFEWYKVTC